MEQVPFHADLKSQKGRTDAMQFAIQVAQKQTPENDIPIAALILDQFGNLVTAETNTSEQDKNPCAHAEVNAIQKAAKLLKSKNLESCSIVTTLEPCAMCAGAILQSHLSKVVFGAWDEKFGACGSNLDLLRDPKSSSKPEVHAGASEEECSGLIVDFFRRLRT